MKKITLLAATFILLLSNVAVAADAVRTTWLGNLAVEGYDPVAYFTENAAVKGSKEFQWEWMDANWRFSSEENLNAFKLEPEKYAPQYGGYCAWAVSNNYTAGIDPEQFTVLDGKLYLNYNAEVQTMWTAERGERIKLADEYWPGLIDE